MISVLSGVISFFTVQSYDSAGNMVPSSLILFFFDVTSALQVDFSP